jgi:hypothetical protein
MTRRGVDLHINTLKRRRRHMVAPRVLYPRTKVPAALTEHLWRENSWIHLTKY